MRPNSQRQRNPTPNLEDEPVDIETDLEDYLNILQQRKKVFKVKNDTVFQLSHDNPPIGQEEYRKRRGVKSSKARKGRRDGRMEQVRGDCMSKVNVHHIHQ